MPHHKNEQNLKVNFKNVTKGVKNIVQFLQCPHVRKISMLPAEIARSLSPGSRWVNSWDGRPTQLGPINGQLGQAQEQARGDSPPFPSPSITGAQRSALGVEVPSKNKITDFSGN